jgi:hypothetical protein
MISELELELCESAGVLPAQMLWGVRWDADTSGPRALMLAVLEDAVGCIERGRRGSRFQERRLAAEAHAWVRSDDRTHPFSFLSITDVLGIDADAVRARLLCVSVDTTWTRKTSRARGRSRLGGSANRCTSGKEA